MRAKFREYYRPSIEEQRVLWDTCMFVIDTNVLLNLYRYSADSRAEFLNILIQVKDQLWVPHQVALEYHNNRLQTITAHYDAYKAIQDGIKGVEQKLQALSNTVSRHPIIQSEIFSHKISEAVGILTTYIATCKSEHEKQLPIDAGAETDEVLEALSQILDGKVGDAYPKDRLAEVHEEASERYAKNIPPGYEDNTKKDNKNGEPLKFGDFVLWRQILDEARTRSVPVILITDDTKEDWWRKHKGKTVGPRLELIREMQRECGTQFYMYRPHQFLKWAKDWRHGHVSDETIHEVNVVGEPSRELIPSIGDVDQAFTMDDERRGTAGLDFSLDTPMARQLAADLDQNQSHRQQLIESISADIHDLMRFQHLEQDMERAITAYESMIDDPLKEQSPKREAVLKDLRIRQASLNQEQEVIYERLARNTASLRALTSDAERIRELLSAFADYSNKQQTLWAYDNRRQLREQREREQRVLRSADQALLENLGRSRK